VEIMPYLISSLIALVVCTILGWLLWPVVTYVLIGIVSVFLIGLVLIQRGRGGGLAGAFGGVGGSSAFGTRAGDVFTRITIVTASVWIALNMGLVVNANTRGRDAGRPGGEFLPQGAATETGADSDFDFGGGGAAVPDFGDDDTAPNLDLDLGTSDLPPALGDDPAPTPEEN
jgi:preprotein translocase subunit SecG